MIATLVGTIREAPLSTSPEPTPRYPGPLPLEQALSAFALTEYSDEAFQREGLRADAEYRDLGLAAATGGQVGARHIRAIKPFGEETGWHWHDMAGHFVFVLKGWITFRFKGVEGDVTVRQGGCLSQPAGVAHNVVARSDDLELIEINIPADYVTLDLGTADAS